jgi:hypothetical protein
MNPISLKTNFGAGVVPPKRELPHAVIDPSALRAAKAKPVE